MNMPAGNSAGRTGDEFEKMLAGVFRKAGWRVRRSPPARDGGADLVLEGREKTYVVGLKTSHEGRRDRLIPLLSQAVLEAKEFARRFPEPAVPVAVVAAERIPPSVAERIHQFAELYAPGVGIGVIDAEGFRSFAGLGLEGLDEKAPRRGPRHVAQAPRLPRLFSDLNQWMLKILVGQRLPETFISVPRGVIRNATQLAQFAGVSVMSASRFVRQLANEGFLDRHQDRIQLVRVEELLERWAPANKQPARDMPARWILKQSERQFFANVVSYAAEVASKLAPVSKMQHRRAARSPSRCCIGLFAAADALGLGVVRGVPPHVYLEELDLEVLQRLGLSIEDTGHRIDVLLRVPSNRESVFRAATLRDGLPVCDVLQVWLDVSSHPSRGHSQADEIRRRALGPLFEKRR